MKTHTTSRSRNNLHHGFSLIEILVAIVVLSLGLLGLAALQMSALRFNQSAHQRTQATTLAADIFDCIRANKTAATSYAITYPTAAPAGTAAYQLDLQNWKGRITTLLGASAQGAIENSGSGKYTVKIRWSDASDAIGDNSSSSTGRATQEFVYIAMP